jgi:hypothetical protein
MNLLDVPGLASLRPANVVDYLRYHGWSVEPGPSREVVRYRSGDVRVTVLLDETFEDYPRRMAEVAETLSRCERRSVFEVVNDLLSPPGDCVRFRIQSESTEAGTVGLQQSLQLRRGLKNLLLSAAHSTLSPQPYFARLTQSKAQELINSCRERQSERGSYVTSILVPVSPPVMGSSLDDELARRTTRMLFRALNAAQRGVGDPDALVSTEKQGVSANFLDALSELEPVGARGSLEVSVNWLGGPPEPVLGETIRIEQPAFRAFRAAARALRGRAPQLNTELEGYIIAVGREVDAARGRATLAAQVETLGEARVKLDLESRNYQTAVEAHRLGRRVRVVGALLRSGRTFSLENPSELELLPDED